MAKSVLSRYKQSPRRVSLLADLIRGKGVSEALTLLAFSKKRAAKAMEKLLRSALANAREEGKGDSSLFVSQIRVDKGQVLKRFRTAWRGQASPIRRRSSHVTIVLEEK